MYNRCCREQNVVLFSAGESREKLLFCKEKFARYHIHAVCYQELFRQSHNQDNIALLPCLMKKIPTFDFAVIIAEGVDRTVLRGQELVSAMRDNVIFEIALCVMSLGADKVILLSQEGIRIPDDLMGVGKIGIRQITFTDRATWESGLEQVAEDIAAAGFDQCVGTAADYILENFANVSPMIAGAAVASAEAYFTNFVLRFLEHLDSGYADEGGDHRDFPEVRLKILLPDSIGQNTRNAIAEFYRKEGMGTGRILTAGFRDLSFRYYYEDGDFTVVDIPTSVTASYSMVKAILNTDANDDADEASVHRFLDKEIDIYIFALSKLCIRNYADGLRSSGKADGKKTRLLRCLDRICIDKIHF